MKIKAGGAEMNFISSPRFLAAYSAVVSTLLVVALLTGFGPSRQRTSFDEIDVHRINVVEPDGTLRMVISNKSVFPGIIIRGKESPHPDRKTAGLLFFNDEGTENGGLIFGGAKDAKGSVESYGHLSFDQYEQDQVFTIDANDQSGLHSSAVTMWDRPEYSIGELLATPPEKRDAFVAAHPNCHARVYLGRNQDHSVALRLKDTNGRDRIVLQVDKMGAPMIQLLDESGKIIGRLPDTTEPKLLK
jgi:hypothetical protein